MQSGFCRVHVNHRPRTSPRDAYTQAICFVQVHFISDQADNSTADGQFFICTAVVCPIWADILG